MPMVFSYPLLTLNKICCHTSCYYYRKERGERKDLKQDLRKAKSFSRELHELLLIFKTIRVN